MRKGLSRAWRLINGEKRVLDSNLKHQGNDQLTPLENSIIGTGLYDLLKYIQGHICKAVADVYNSVDLESTTRQVVCALGQRCAWGSKESMSFKARVVVALIQAVEVAGGGGFGRGVATGGGVGEVDKCQGQVPPKHVVS